MCWKAFGRAIHPHGRSGKWVMLTADFLVIGGGIIGISVARELKRRFSDSSVLLIEKELTSGEHASGRNSGVLHAGFYYTADSLKARFTVEGNRYLTEYCYDKNIPINQCGKLIVAQSSAEHALLDELLIRGKHNGVELESITAKEAEEIEPRVRTCERAIFSPATSSVNPVEIVNAMVIDAKDEGVDIHYGMTYLRHENGNVVTTKGDIQAGYVVNSAGLYADQIACDFGFSKKYRILPFKGLYLYSEEPAGAMRTNIYPVPDLKNPFLGVHFTLTVDQRIKIGPTAIPAFWREQYKGLDNFDFSEFVDVIKREMGLLVSSDFDFMQLAVEELRKYSRSRMVSLASKLVKDIDKNSYKYWARPGIRAQLLNIEEKKLEMDFVVEGDDKSFHILNAVSPAFTCSFPFAKYVCDMINEKFSKKAGYRPESIDECFVKASLI